MKSRNFKFSIDVWIVFLMLVCQVIELLFFVSRGIFTLVPLFCLWFFIISTQKSSFSSYIFLLYKNRSQIFFLIIFVIGVFFNYGLLRGSSNGLSQLLIFVQYIPIILVSVYYSTNTKIIEKNSILFLLVVMLGLQAIISIPFILSNDPTFIRSLSSGELRTEENAAIARLNGVGTNSLYSSLAGIIILSFSVFFNNNYSLFVKVLVLGSIVGMVVTILLSTFVASILLLLLGIAFYFFLQMFLVNRKKFFKYLFSLAFIFCLFFLIFDFYLIDSDWFQPIMFKLELFNERGGDVTGRDKLALVSLKTFLDNPVIGIGVPEKNSYHLIGEHLPWMDSFATYGFILFGLFLVFLFSRFRNVLRNLNISDQFSNYRIACITGCILFVISNFISPMLFVPASYIFLFFFYTNFSE